MSFFLDNIEINLTTEDQKTILRTSIEYRVFHRTIDDVKSVLEKNYSVVKDQFKNKRGSVVSDRDLDEVCLDILLFFAQTRNMGFDANRKDMLQVLSNEKKDFDRSSKEIIMNHFRRKYPSDFVGRCV